MARINGVAVSDDVLKRLMERSAKNKQAKTNKPLVQSSSSGSSEPKKTAGRKRGESSGGKKTKKQITDELREKDDDLGWLDALLAVDRELVMAVVANSTKAIKSVHKKRIAELAINRAMYTGQLREHFIQVRLFHYVETNYPEYYDDMYANPMGGYRPTQIGWEMTAEGAKTGQPDINVDCPKGRYFGLRLEVKSRIGTPSDKQLAKLERLNKRGYLAVLGWGYDECKKILDEYFTMEDSLYLK